MYMRKDNDRFMLFVTKALLFVFVVIIVSCSGNSNKDSEHAFESSAVNEQLMKGEIFTAFIDRFHSDSVFAVSRISESVTGINTDAEKYDSIADKYSCDYVWSLEEIKDVQDRLPDLPYKAEERRAIAMECLKRSSELIREGENKGVNNGVNPGAYYLPAPQYNYPALPQVEKQETSYLPSQQYIYVRWL